MNPVRSLAELSSVCRDLGGATSNGMTFFRIIFIFTLAFFAFADTALAQRNVTLYSVSPASAPVGATVIITGSNLLRCAPVFAGSALNPACNVQFHDINVRRSTTSGTETSNTTIQATVADGLCPGTTTIKVGELIDFSNSIPFTILDQGNVPLGCRVITSIVPTSGTIGTVVTINGRKLHPNVQLYDSSFRKTDVTGTINSTENQVTFSMPSTLIPGTYSVRVGPNGNDVSNGLPFNFLGDTTAPFISNIRINNVTTSGATVTWDTNEPADGQVEYCLTNARCTTNSPLISGLTTSHIVNLAGLTPNTRYYLWIKSKDGRPNSATAGPLTFRTLIIATPTPTPTPQIILPVISNVQVTNITRDSAVVSWNTNLPTDSRINSCFMIFCFGSLLDDQNLTTSHIFTITGLRANNNQYIQINATDNSGNSGSSDIITFKTLVGLTISNLNIVNITQSSFTITWDTNYPADSQLVFCTTYFFCYFSTPVSDSALTLSHSLTAPNLQAGSLYYYYVLSKDGKYKARSGVGDTRTLP